jgi:hypothetical protein
MVAPLVMNTEFFKILVYMLYRVDAFVNLIILRKMIMIYNAQNAIFHAKNVTKLLIIVHNVMKIVLLILE